MTCLPTGTHEKAQKIENAPFSKNVTEEYNCPERFSTMYFAKNGKGKPDDLMSVIISWIPTSEQSENNAGSIQEWVALPR